MAVVFTSTDLANLKAALVTGAMEVTIGDRTVKYRSQKDLIEAIKMVQLYLEGVPDESPNVIQATYSRTSRTSE